MRRQILRSFVGLAGESRVQDANSQVFHIQGVIPSNLANGRIEPAAPPTRTARRCTGRTWRARPRTRRCWRPPVARPPPIPAEARREARDPLPLRDFLAVVGLLVVGVTVAVVILSQQGLRFPLVEDSPKRIEVELQDAQAVEPGRGQTVRVAGVEIGKIAGVHLEDGVAVVELDIDRHYEDMVREDATALLRPKTALKDMFLEVDPGQGRVLPEGGRIGVEGTRARRGPRRDLRRPRRGHAPVPEPAGVRAPARACAVAARTSTPCCAGSSRSIATWPGSRAPPPAGGTRSGAWCTATACSRPSSAATPAELRRLVSASGEVFGALAGEEQDISTATARLPGALEQSSRTLGRGRRVRPRAEADARRPAPADPRLEATNAAVRPFLREATSILRDQIRPFVRAARPWTADLRVATVNGAKAAPDLTDSLDRAQPLLQHRRLQPRRGARACPG